MGLLDDIVEARIAEAMQRGDFDNLSTAGQPLELDDDSMVPEELRVAYRLLKNSGHLPPELQLRREIADVGVLLSQCNTTEARTDVMKRLDYFLTRLNLSSNLDVRSEHEYRAKLLASLTREK